MAETEHHEHVRTQEALETLTKWGRDPGTDGGENIVFSVARQGTPSDAFLATGDCTPFTPSGSRGTLNGQPPGPEARLRRASSPSAVPEARRP